MLFAAVHEVKAADGFVVVGFDDRKGQQQENMSLREFLRTRPRFGIQRGALEEEEEADVGFRV